MAAPTQAPARSTNVMAILALVFAFVFSPLGIVFGAVAKKQIARTGEEGMGLAKAGFWLGIVFTVLGVLWFVLVFGIGFSLLALMTRRWVLAWIALAGSAIASEFGVFSIWHRQTPGLNNYVGAGPGFGLILGTLAIMVLTFHWVKVVWSRTALQLAAEEQRRISAAAEEERQRRRRLDED